MTVSALIAKAIIMLFAVLVVLGCRSGSPIPSGGSQDPSEPDKTAAVVVLMRTSMGPIKIQLYPDKVPGTVANFLTYVDEAFYDGTIFHRVINDFMIQGGGFTPDMQERTAHPPIPNEARDDLKNLRGTVAMARTPAIHSASSQFFINVKDNAVLDHADETPRGFGYCVFGKVVEGMDVVDRIRSVATARIGGYDDVPSEPVIIESVRRAE